MCEQTAERREQNFVLDCVAVSALARGYEHTRPRLWSVVPEYDARNDPYAIRYTSIPWVQRVLLKVKSEEKRSATAQKSLDLRNSSGAGHSKEQMSNHNSPMSDIKPQIGYNGQFGFRRNTPNLRQNPSSFGEVTTFKLY
ncbi:hypothetical protein DPEC_G00151060 [Dallia pectoralis]|uniref:Uncharacterized protein n=1 Tax=Dallia pectoralis TaxID=75939 RepID=A0ACC2GJI7_DALPE|nr:hypothetical protein DPEC_G00151060 [Dallia pectoralis]